MDNKGNFDKKIEIKNIKEDNNNKEHKSILKNKNINNKIEKDNEIKEENKIKLKLEKHSIKESSEQNNININIKVFFLLNILFFSIFNWIIFIKKNECFWIYILNYHTFNFSNSSNTNESFYSNYCIEKKKSKFYKMFRNNSVSNREKSDNKDNNCKLYLTPFWPEEINDEIYSGEELKIKPLDLNIIINANSNSAKINNIYATINTNINKISNINPNENIKSKTILSLSRSSFSLINNNKNNSFNINRFKIS